MGNKLRIGYGGIGVESSSFTPVVATKATFRIYRGQEVLAKWLSQPAEELNIELVPLFLAGSTPSGSVPRKDWEELKGEFLRDLKNALPLDGLLVRAHGATIVDDADSGELDLFRSIRQVVGQDLPISWGADLHGNIPSEIPSLVTIITAYRTAPHKDGVETIVRALRLLVDCIRSGTKMYQALVRVPVLLPGEKVITEVEPGKGLYGAINTVMEKGGIVDASIFVGFGWSDVPHAGASVVALSNRSEVDATQAAQMLATEYWNRRNQFCFEGETLHGEAAIDAALTREGTVFISDAGDNISAGAPGDSIYLLKLLLARGIDNSVFAPLVDGPATEACANAGVGGEVTVSLGGTLSNGETITVTGRVAKVLRRAHDVVVVLNVGSIEVVLLSVRGYFHMPEEYESLGIKLLSKRIVVLKLGYLYPELRSIAPHSIMCLSPGPSGLVLEDFKYVHLTRPMFPFDSFE